MAKFVVAVSGGVDSVVLLDMLASKRLPTTYHLSPTTYQLIVAHFDHGIRPDSADDAKFVEELAAKYGLEFVSKREELGADASEELARVRRYAFLRSVAKKHEAKIITAHHADDVVETIAINLIRGTGWRGLAVLDSPDIDRPLLHKRKSELYNYAEAHNLTWHEDSTNASDTYLRNRLRQKLAYLDDDVCLQLLALRDTQVYLRREINVNTVHLIDSNPFNRHLFIMANHMAGIELLREALLLVTAQSFLSSQLERTLHAIKIARPDTYHDVGAGVRLRFTRTKFVVEHF